MFSNPGVSGKSTNRVDGFNLKNFGNPFFFCPPPLTMTWGGTRHQLTAIKSKQWAKWYFIWSVAVKQYFLVFFINFFFFQ